MGNETSGITSFITAEYRRLVRYAARLVDGMAELDAEDVVQDVMVRFFARPSGSIPVSRLAAYFYRAIRNQVVDLYRARRSLESVDALVAANSRERLGNLLTDLRDDVAAEAEQRELQERLYRAIGELPAHEREVLLATEFAGRKFADLANEMGVPIGTLLSRKSRAVARLRAAFPEISKGEEHDGYA